MNVNTHEQNYFLFIGDFVIDDTRINNGDSFVKILSTDTIFKDCHR